MLTSDELNSRLDRMRQAGLRHYIVKPVKRFELFRALQEALSGEVNGYMASNSESKNSNPAMTRPARVLLAEDNPGNRMLVKAYLKGNPFEIDEAENGAIAMNKFTSRKYDLVLMDMYMPVVDGYEATAAIRKWELEQKVPRTPIIALTAAAMSGDMQRSLDAGCDLHVTKPVSKAILINLFETILQGRNVDEAPASSYGGVSDLDDPALLAEVSQLFVTEMDKLMVSINEAFQQSDIKKLKDYVHSLKGSAAMVGAAPIAKVCKEIEAAIAMASNDGIRAKIAELHSEQPRARAEMGKRTEMAAQA
jgi:CheY-like chemotaxis protein